MKTVHVVAGRYEIEATVGSGGMAQVYRARDTKLGRTVALKVLAPSLASDPTFVERFKREAHAAASLNHPNVARVFDSGSDDGTHYLVMELVPGRALRDALASEAPLEPARAARIAAGVCDALAAAHAKGIVHRDVKPANVMLTERDGVKLTDFGIARVADGTSLTRTATLLGSADYLSPEQARGETVGPRSDLYSLGVVLYEMLCGRLPFAGPTALAVAQQHVESTPKPPSRWNPSVHPALEALVMRAMDKDPGNRPAGAAAMREELERALDLPAHGSTQVIPRRATEVLQAVRIRGFPLWAKLMGACLIVVAATLLVVAGLSVQLARGHLAKTLDERLGAAVGSFQAGPARSIRAPADLAPRAREWLAASAFPGDQVVAVRTAAGEVLTSAGGVDLARLRGSRDLLESTRSRWWSLDGVRALSVPLMLDGRQEGTLVAAASEAPVDATIGGLISGIGWAALGGLLFAGIAGLALIRRTLAPLRRMSSDIEAMKATGDLTRRVRHGGAVDEVGQLGREFNRLLDELQHTFERQRLFIADASHELRTPLTVVRGRLELLQDELRSHMAGAVLEPAISELDRMARMVDELLLLARLDEGLQIDLAPVEVELVAREALLRGLQLARRRTHVEAEQGVYALADEQRLLQVLTNLVANGIRHTSDDARLELVSRQEGDRIVIDVADDGDGIPPAELPHVFERFYRGPAARASASEGAGLGLAIAQSLVKAMGGDISVRSGGGKGTTFTVTLPAHGGY